MGFDLQPSLSRVRAAGGVPERIPVKWNRVRFHLTGHKLL
jgi:hypothetical protein